MNIRVTMPWCLGIYVLLQLNTARCMDTSTEIIDYMDCTPPCDNGAVCDPGTSICVDCKYFCAKNMTYICAHLCPQLLSTDHIFSTTTTSDVYTINFKEPPVMKDEQTENYTIRIAFVPVVIVFICILITLAIVYVKLLCKRSSKYEIRPSVIQLPDKGTNHLCAPEKHTLLHQNDAWNDRNTQSINAISLELSVGAHTSERQVQTKAILTNERQTSHAGEETVARYVTNIDDNKVDIHSPSEVPHIDVDSMTPRHQLKDRSMDRRRDQVRHSQSVDTSTQLNEESSLLTDDSYTCIDRFDVCSPADETENVLCELQKDHDHQVKDNFTEINDKSRLSTSDGNPCVDEIDGPPDYHLHNITFGPNMENDNYVQSLGDDDIKTNFIINTLRNSSMSLQYGNLENNIADSMSVVLNSSNDVNLTQFGEEPENRHDIADTASYVGRSAVKCTSACSSKSCEKSTCMHCVLYCSQTQPNMHPEVQAYRADIVPLEPCQVDTRMNYDTGSHVTYMSPNSTSDKHSKSRSNSGKEQADDTIVKVAIGSKLQNASLQSTSLGSHGSRDNPNGPARPDTNTMANSPATCNDDNCDNMLNPSARVDNSTIPAPVSVTDTRIDAPTGAPENEIHEVALVTANAAHSHSAQSDSGIISPGPSNSTQSASISSEHQYLSRTRLPISSTLYEQENIEHKPKRQTIGNNSHCLQNMLSLHQSSPVNAHRPMSANNAATNLESVYQTEDNNYYNAQDVSLVHAQGFGIENQSMPRNNVGENVRPASRTMDANCQSSHDMPLVHRNGLRDEHVPMLETAINNNNHTPQHLSALYGREFVDGSQVMSENNIEATNRPAGRTVDNNYYTSQDIPLGHSLVPVNANQSIPENNIASNHRTIDQLLENRHHSQQAIPSVATSNVSGEDQLISENNIATMDSAMIESPPASLPIERDCNYSSNIDVHAASSGEAERPLMDHFHNEDHNEPVHRFEINLNDAPLEEQVGAIGGAVPDEQLDGAVGGAPRSMDDMFNGLNLDVHGNSLPDDVNYIARSLTDDSGAVSIFNPDYEDRSGFHMQHHDNNPLYEQLQNIPWVLGYHSQGRSISVYADLDNRDVSELHQELVDKTHQPWASLGSSEMTKCECTVYTP